MAALSIRLDDETERLLQAEVVRRKTTKTQLVQELLRAALQPKDAVLLLEALREQHGLNVLAQTAPQTERSSQVKAQVRRAVAQKLERPASP